MIKEQARPEIIEPIGVLGYGVEGVSTCKYLLDRGFSDITVFDRKAPSGLDARIRFHGAEGSGGSGYLSGLASMRTVFRSAGVRPDLPEIAAFLRQGGTLTSQTGLAFALAGRENIIGVTGTVGKGTCCSLLADMLAEADIPARLGGNIGVPALDLAASLPAGEKLILELSSFQLSALAQSPAYAAVLRTTTEHLDWHPDRAEYWLHKSRLVSEQSEGDVLSYCADAEGSAWIANRSRARKIAFGTDAEVRVDDREARWTKRGFKVPLAATRLKGAFNLENIAAAGTLALELGAEPRHVVAAAMAFKGLEHRLEFVRERNGVAFYNDSYATRPEASLGAVKALKDAPLGLILGGSEKHADFAELAASLAAAAHVRAIALIGQTSERLASELRAAGIAVSAGGPDIRLCATLEEAVEFLLARIDAGAIALSPACASFGMFENYKERGKAFKRLVASL
jgi:UDP-N-acetylmuramoylalanine--D-glutamate ligase